MNVFLSLMCLIAAALSIGLMRTNGLVGILLTCSVSAIIVYLINNTKDKEVELLIRIFVVALLARFVLVTIAYGFQFDQVFASDGVIYDERGNALVEYFLYNVPISETNQYYLFDLRTSGTGMYYLVGSIYLIVGRNPLAASYFCGIVGAATAPLIYFCSIEIFNNRKVALYSACFIALFPAMIAWSSFLLKDGIMIFCLVLAIFSFLKVQKQFSYLFTILLMVALVGVVGLRFYVFVMLAVAIFAGLVIGTQNSVRSLLARVITIAVAGAFLTFFGINQMVLKNVDEYGSLERIQASRLDLSLSGDSGFGRDLDVSTTEGAISALPIGFTYLYFAPFPWEATSFISTLTLPDTLLWWTMMPFLIIGIIFAIKNRPRENIAILIFILTLTLFYSLFQGNVGTAYRHRTQLQVFLFMFIAVGIEITREKYENKRLLANSRRKRYQLKSIS